MAIKYRRGNYTTGMRIGLLVLVKRTQKRIRSYHIWRCKCDCGKYVLRNVSYFNGRRRSHGIASCGCQTYAKGKANANWKGGRGITKDGYVRIHNPAHPNQSCSYVFEHVEVMSRHLGRPLSKGELVHHKNGIKTDNKLSNLELCLKSTHMIGQRVTDVIADALRKLQRYAPSYLRKDLRCL